MIVAHRRVTGIAFEQSEVFEDAEAIAASQTFAKRITVLKSGSA